MKRFPKTLTNTLTGFARDEGGIAAVDFVLMLPLYMFATLGTFTYWDAWDVVNRSQKATYTVSDLITREMDEVSEDYVDGLFSVLDYLMGPNQTIEGRITSVFYNGADDQYEVIWSRSSDLSMPELTTGTITSIQSELPDLADGEAVVIVESEVDFTPMFGLLDIAMIEDLAGKREHIIVTRPRFVPKVCMEDVYCG